jgi:hypothetical protein
MSAANFLSTQEVVGASHHSVAMENYSDADTTEDVGVSEKPLGRFDKSLFALISG